MTATSSTPMPGAFQGTELDLLLVDDHRIFAEVLAIRLEAESAIGRVDRAASLGEARALITQRRPDVVLLDLYLGDESGLDLLRELSAETGPPAVMLSGAGDVDGIIEAVRAGAHGWVPKDAQVETLLDASETVAAGNMFLPAELLRPVLRRLLREKAPARTRGLLDEVTPRELEVLRCLVAGMSRAEVAKRLYLTTNTVRTHVQNLLRRTELHSTLALVALARHLGISGIDEPDGSSSPALRTPSIVLMA